MSERVNSVVKSDKEKRIDVLENRRIISNVVEKEELRIMQSRTLNILKDVLSKSFGPYGSNTIITKIIGDGTMVAPNQYTKDGHTILKNIVFQDIIEMSTRDSIEDITRSIVNKVGDGTTSAVILSAVIFDELTKLESKGELMPYEIIKDFNKAVENICEEILKNKKEFTHNDAYDIAYVSTNGSEELATIISDIYKKYGPDTHIDLDTSPTEDHIIREYEGIVHHDGYMDSRFINRKSTGTSELDNPEIYVFLDPINNQVIGSTFLQILNNNIVSHMQNPEDFSNIKNTVIVAPSISIDFASYIDSIMGFYNQYDIDTNLLIVTGTARDESLEDIAVLTGAKIIRKYIDREKYEEDVEKGLAANADNVKEFAGSAELVKADYNKTMFINPKNQLDECGNPTSIYKNLMDSIRAELENAEKESSNTTQKHILKRRLRSLTSSNIDFLIGGVAQSDRENIRALLEDAVKNCRSSAEHGYGQGANLEGYIAVTNLLNNTDDELYYMYSIIKNAYHEVLYTLLNISGLSDDEISLIINNMYKKGIAYNVRTNEYDGKVKTSIMSDPNILEAISKIVTRMVTANQFLCPDIHFNRYMG